MFVWKLFITARKRSLRRLRFYTCLSFCPQGWGACSWEGGACSGGFWSRGCLVETPLDDYCCGRYASYWNAFVFTEQFVQTSYTQNEQVKIFEFFLQTLYIHSGVGVVLKFRNTMHRQRRLVSNHYL